MSPQQYLKASRIKLIDVTENEQLVKQFINHYYPKCAASAVGKLLTKGKKSCNQTIATT